VARAGRRAWLVTVTQTFGASPRPPGSLLALRDDAHRRGAVSGGCIEDDLVARREEFTGRAPHFVSYGVTRRRPAASGCPAAASSRSSSRRRWPLADLETLMAHIACAG